MIGTSIITTEEAVKYVDVERINGTGISNYKFTCAKVMVTNASEGNGTSTDFQVRLNKGELYLSAPTSFLNNELRQYWAGCFDIVNSQAFGQNIAPANIAHKAQVLMPTNQDLFSALTTIIAFRFKSVTGDIPVGTNIKIWFK